VDQPRRERRRRGVGFLGVCEVGEIAMEASRCGSGVDQLRRDRRRRGVVRCGAMEASRRGSRVDQPRRHRRARCL
jgi:hypothetical protein